MLYYIFCMMLFGITCEIFFTSLFNFFVNKDKNLLGEVSLWMFPIYGLGLSYGFDFASFLIDNTWLRIIAYPFWIWSVELLYGSILLHYNIRPWDYCYLNKSLHYRGIISYAHFPAWLLLGGVTELYKNYILVL